MTKCVFCGNDAHDFTGVHLIKNDGTVDFLCSSKCRKNMLKLKRDKRNMKWTVSYKDKLKALSERAVSQAKKASDKIISDKTAADKLTAERAASKAVAEKKAKAK
jgi:large subunit ribosomal protein L24e